MAIMDIAEFSEYNEEMFEEFIRIQEFLGFIINVPRWRGIKKDSLLAEEYVRAAYAGEELSMASNGGFYCDAPEDNWEDFSFWVQTNDPAKLAKALYRIAGRYSKAPKRFADFILEVFIFYERALRDKRPRACEDLLKIARDLKAKASK